MAFDAWFLFRCAGFSVEGTIEALIASHTFALIFVSVIKTARAR